MRTSIAALLCLAAVPASAADALTVRRFQIQAPPSHAYS